MNRFDTNNPLIYIVMANYNGYPLTAESIQSLHGLTYSNCRIVVVDDCSKDDSMSKLKQNFPDILVLSTKKNSGLCTAYNTGIREALKNDADYVFLVQNDTKNFSPNYLEEILRVFEKDQNVGMVGSLVYDYIGNSRWDGKAKSKFGIPLEISEGFVIKHEVFENIGLFNERLVVYFEDIDFVIRLRNAGYNTAVADSVSFDHVGQGTFSKQSFYPNYIRIRNIPFFMRRYCKDRPLGWKMKQFLLNMRIHVEKIYKTLIRGDFISFVAVSCAIVLGTISGLLLPWSEENEC